MRSKSAIYPTFVQKTQQIRSNRYTESRFGDFVSVSKPQNLVLISQLADASSRAVRFQGIKPN